jgi:hypothetical protein
MNNIWSPKIANGTQQACCKIPYKGYEISIAMDDSCGAYDSLSRSSICVFRDGEDVTESSVQGDDVIVADAHALKYIFNWIDTHVQVFGE